MEVPDLARSDSAQRSTARSQAGERSCTWCVRPERQALPSRMEAAAPAVVRLTVRGLGRSVGAIHEGGERYVESLR
jgi:hypothetical protein